MHEIETKHKRSRVHYQNWILKRLTSLIRIQLHLVAFFLSFSFFFSLATIVFHSLCLALTWFSQSKIFAALQQISRFFHSHSHSLSLSSFVFTHLGWMCTFFPCAAPIFVHLFSFQFSVAFICTFVSHTKLFGFVHDISVALNYDFRVAYFACRQCHTRYPISRSLALFFLLSFVALLLLFSFLPFALPAIDFVDFEAKPAQGAQEWTFSVFWTATAVAAKAVHILRHSGNGDGGGGTWLVGCCCCLFLLWYFFENAHSFQQFNSLACWYAFRCVYDNAVYNVEFDFFFVRCLPFVYLFRCCHRRRLLLPALTVLFAWQKEGTYFPLHNEKKKNTATIVVVDVLNVVVFHVFSLLRFISCRSLSVAIWQNPSTSNSILWRVQDIIQFLAKYL